MTRATNNLCFLALSALIFAGSCSKDWLDKKPQTKLAVPTSLKDFQALLNNEELFNANSPELGNVAAEGVILADNDYNTSSDNEKNAYSWSNQFSYSGLLDWNGPYQCIFTSNIVLEGLAYVKPESASEQVIYNDIKGQALFHRSKMFYEIAQIWAPAYSESSAASDLGIPLRLKSNINIPSTRSTVKDTYDQIVSDLLTAKKLIANQLPTTIQYKLRPTKTAVFALLSRIFLSMEKYAESKLYADSCLQIYNALLDYNSIPVPYPARPVSVYNEETIFYNTLVNNYAGTRGSKGRIDPMFYSLYETNDLRRGVFFRTTSGNLRFRGSYTQSPTNFGGLAVDEIYLTRAECLAREGKVTEALEDLNLLLKNRKDAATFLPVTAADAEDALRKIITERKKELLFRGIAWADRRRLNRDSRFAQPFARTVNGVTYTLEPNGYNYIFPIPDDIIQRNEIPQNPGWQ